MNANRLINRSRSARHRSLRDFVIDDSAISNYLIFSFFENNLSWDFCRRVYSCFVCRVRLCVKHLIFFSLKRRSCFSLKSFIYFSLKFFICSSLKFLICFSLKFFIYSSLKSFISSSASREWARISLCRESSTSEEESSSTWKEESKASWKEESNASWKWWSNSSTTKKSIDDAKWISEETKFIEDWNRSTYDVATRFEKKEKRTRTEKRERRTSASIKRTILRILSMLSFICNWSHCALNEWKIVYRSLEEISND